MFEEFLDEIFFLICCMMLIVNWFYFFFYFLMVCVIGGICGFYDLRKIMKWNKVIDVYMYFVIFIYMYGMFVY